MWTHEHLRSKVSNLNSTEYRWDNLHDSLRSLSKSAVLVPLTLKDGVIYIWLTKRSEDVKIYKSQVSFPGGKWEKGDRNAVDTALREAHEEIGLCPDEVEVVAELIPAVSIHKILVTPVVGIVCEDFHPKPNNEVALAFKLPLERFLLDDNHWASVFTFPLFQDYLHFFQDDVDGESVVTWGMTAHFAMGLACGIFQKSPQFAVSQNLDMMPDDPMNISRQSLYIKWWEHIDDEKSKL